MSDWQHIPGTRLYCKDDDAEPGDTLRLTNYKDQRGVGLDLDGVIPLCVYLISKHHINAMNSGGRHVDIKSFRELLQGL